MQGWKCFLPHVAVIGYNYLELVTITYKLAFLLGRLARAIKLFLNTNPTLVTAMFPIGKLSWKMGGESKWKATFPV